MNKLSMFWRWFLFLFVLCIMPLQALAADGPMPVPVFTDVTVRGSVSYDNATGLYTYSYTVGNPATNTGEIEYIWLDITRPQFGEKLSSDDLTVGYLANRSSFDEEIATYRDPKPMVPVGTVEPQGWSSGIGARGAVRFSRASLDTLMKPGEEKSGFQVISRGLPGIREATIEPRWLLISTEGEPTDEEVADAIRITKSLMVHKTTIGPTAPTTQNFVWEQADTNIPDYINRAVTLGWLNDAALADALREKLVQARDLFNTDPSQAKVRLNEFMTLIDQATGSQITPEGRGLLYFNALDLRNRLPETTIH